ncbi:MAG: DUF1257 domain-containing protein [Planctomycetaceae bacterium]|nr:DUF1257 domain-containing protein [Planctomycetaceae bacterium]
MSTVLIVAPIVISSWPMIAPAIAAVVTASGYALVKQTTDAKEEANEGLEEDCEEISLENSEILADAKNLGESMTIVKDNIRATFHRDARGQLRLTVSGKGLSKKQMRAIGEELIGLVTQQYAYHRLVTEMKARGMTIVEEEVEADQTVKIRVRNW